MIKDMTNSNAPESYTFRNETLEFSLDHEGQIISLVNLHAGHNYASGSSLWRMYFDRHNEKDIEVIAGENKPNIVQNGSQIRIEYENLMVRGVSVQIRLTLYVVLEESGIRFASEVYNDEPQTIIREFQYPLLGDCNVPADHQLLTTQRGGHVYPDIKAKISSLPHTYLGPDHRFRQMNLIYPMDVSANCFALFGKSQGLYVGSHDESFQDTCQGFRLYPGMEAGCFNKLEVGIYKYPQCLSGQSWSNDSNIIVPYSGTWHQTSRIYRKWVDLWWNQRKPPAWVQKMIGFQRIIMRHQYGETFFTYDDFNQKVRRSAESVGIRVALPFGWWGKGMDNGYPDSYYEANNDQGGEAAWKKAIADYKSGGGKVLLYFNGKLIDTASDYYKSGDGQEVCFKSNTNVPYAEAYRFYGGGTFTGYYNTRSFVVADTSQPRWQKKLIEMADRAMELGADSVFYDQLGYIEAAERGWDLSKEFPVTDLTVITSKANALKKVHDYLDTKNKDFAIGTEHITDVTSQHVDYVHGIFHAGNWTVKEHTNFVDWFRYTFPEVIISDRNVDGDEPDVEWLTNRAMVLGLRTNVQTFRMRALIDATPRYQKHLAAVNVIKERYIDLLMQGTYCDTEGIVINEDAGIMTRGYMYGNQKAVLMTHKEKNRKTTGVECPGYGFKEYAAVGDVKLTKGSQNAPLIELDKDALAVLIFEKVK